MNIVASTGQTLAGIAVSAEWLRIRANTTVSPATIPARVVQATGQVFTGLRAEGRDHLPVTTRVLLDVFAPLSLIQQRLRVGTAVVTVTTPTTLTAIQAQILDRLDLMRPEAYLQPTITPHPT